ncbi:mesothelin-like [Lithobates pipiens]
MGPYTSQSQCKDYFTRVGKANIDLLPQGSKKRTSLLSSAISCLNINSNSITKDNLVTLGNLACDLTGKEIISCDSYILEALKICSSFTADQRVAIVTRLKAKYGDPSTWTLSTMKLIGSLSSSLDRSTMRLINTAVKIRFFPRLLSSLKVQNKATFSFVLSQLTVSPGTATRDVFVSCDEELTIDIINNQMDLIAATYSAAQLDACITNKTLIDSLTILGGLALTDDQLQVLKARLDMIFSSGIPEPYLIQLGNIARMYSEEEMSFWNITSVDTLATVIQSASWNSNDPKVNELVQRYLQLDYANGSLDGTLLTVLAPYISSLNETLIQNISYASLGNSSQPLDISTCSQSIKNLLFDKMKMVYSSYNNSSNAYFQIMEPVIGGARASDLIAFASGFPEMDITTFTSLNPDAVKVLSVQNIVDLLGDNVLDIGTIFNSSVLLAWAEANNQIEVNNATVFLQSVLAALVTNADVLLNEALLKTYLNIIAPQNVPVFLQTITSMAIQANLSEEQITTIKTTLLAVELIALQTNVSNYTTEQWTVLFQVYLFNVTAYFNQTLLQFIPKNITCSSYQAIVKAFSLQFSSMTNDAREAIYQNFLKPYLTTKAANYTVVCDAGSFENWRELNFGAFFYFFSLEEIMTLNKNFTLDGAML